MLRAFALAVLLGVAQVSLATGIVKKQSVHTVDATLDKLAEIVEAKGFNVIARVDHATAAANVEMALRPTQVLIFGNPKVGTALMNSNQMIGLDLPVRVLAYEDEEGRVWVAYHLPAALMETHEITDRDEIRSKMTQALDVFTTKATQ